MNRYLAVLVLSFAVLADSRSATDCGTGIYLLHRGQYADGHKTGDWTECDRFERCSFNTYEGGVKQ